MQAGGLNVCIFRPSRQRLSADSRGDFCQKLLHLSMQVCRACMQVCSACMQASRQAPLQHLSSTSGPKSQILGVIPVRICLFWAPRSSDACMQAGRQAPLQNQAGTSPEPCRPGEGGKKAIFERALRPDSRGEKPNPDAIDETATRGPGEGWGRGKPLPLPLEKLVY